MLYLDYGHRDGDWVPNQYGGRENVDAIAFLRRFNEWAYHEFPDVMTMAEESTTWPMVSRPTYVGGLGFGFKWNMGWMHDMLHYASCDPVFRSYHHNRITFSLLYAFSENYVLPFSHDEVVHGKGSMIVKMPGDDWQKFATLRSLYGYMFTHPGKKLLFMGNEIGQRREWDVGASLDWDLMNQPLHRGLQHWVRDMNAFLRGSPALYEADFDPRGFEWIDCSDAQQSVVCFLRYGRSSDDPVLVVCNFTPVVRHEYVVGVPFGGYWRERLNSDAPLYGGSGQGNLGGVHAESAPAHGRAHSLTLTLPPLSIVAFQRSADERHAA